MGFESEEEATSTHLVDSAKLQDRVSGFLPETTDPQAAGSQLGPSSLVEETYPTQLASTKTGMGFGSTAEEYIGTRLSPPGDPETEIGTQLRPQTSPETEIGTQLRPALEAEENLQTRFSQNSVDQSYDTTRIVSPRNKLAHYQNFVSADQIPPVAGIQTPFTPSQAPMTAIYQGSNDWQTSTQIRDRFVAPEEKEQSTTVRLDTKKLLIWGVGSLVIAIICGVLYLQLFKKPTTGADTIVAPTSGMETAQGLSGEQVVSDYLHALAAGDVEKAQSLGTVGPGQRDPISANAYQEMLKDSPITDITVESMASGASSVQASYQLAGEPVTTNFPLTKTDTGGWRLAKSTVTFNFVMPNATSVPLTLNGVAVDNQNPVELLPGKYRISTGLPYLDFLDNPIQTLTSLDYAGSNEIQLTLVLTPSGAQQLTQASKLSLQHCLSSNQLAPDSCPIAANPSKSVRPETIRWGLVNDPWADSVPVLSPTNQAIGEIPLAIDTSFSVEYADGTSAGVTNSTFNAVAYADVTVLDPKQLQILWR